MAIILHLNIDSIAKNPCDIYAYKKDERTYLPPHQYESIHKRKIHHLQMYLLLKEYED